MSSHSRTIAKSITAAGLAAVGVGVSALPAASVTNSNNGCTAEVAHDSVILVGNNVTESGTAFCNARHTFGHAEIAIEYYDGNVWRWTAPVQIPAPNAWATVQMPRINGCGTYWARTRVWAAGNQSATPNAQTFGKSGSFFCSSK